MENAQENLTIGAFAKAAGVNVETIRFYQLKGLLPQPERPYGSIRRYSGADVARVRFVKVAQHLGFSLDEIGQLLKLDYTFDVPGQYGLPEEVGGPARFVFTAAQSGTHQYKDD